MWDLAFAEDQNGRERTLDRAEKEYRTSENLWQLAKSDRVMGFQGESLIRYFLHLAGLDVRMELSRQFISGENLVEGRCKLSGSAQTDERSNATTG